jgi:hypothetical protein
MGYKIVRNNQPQFCRDHGVSGTWRSSPDPVAALKRKAGEEILEFAEARDPAELFDIEDVLRALIFLADPEGEAARQHVENRAGIPRQVLPPGRVPAVSRRLWALYGDYLETADPCLLLSMRDGVQAMITALDPDGRHAAAHRQKVDEMGPFSQYVEWDPVPPPAQPGSSRARWSGKIERWNSGDSYGFVKSDSGVQFFISRNNDPRMFSRGDRVTFTGAPQPAAGQRYPEGYALEPARSQQVMS